MGVAFIIFCNGLYFLGICLIPLRSEAEATTKEWTVLELPWHRTLFAIPVVLGLGTPLEGSVIVFLESCHLPQLTQRQAHPLVLVPHSIILLSFFGSIIGKGYDNKGHYGSASESRPHVKLLLCFTGEPSILSNITCTFIPLTPSRTRTRLQWHSMPLAWRLDREIRSRLILHETAFTR